MIRADTLFLDRDGVINIKLKDRYVQYFSEFQFIDKSLDAIRILTDIFKRIIIVTNQQGIGKGIMSKEDLNKLHQNMISEINLHGGQIDKIYYCPHLESDRCNCRKPANGMIKKALQDFPEIIINRSFLIGDSESDILAGKSMHMCTVKVDNEFTLFSWVNQILSAKG